MRILCAPDAFKGTLSAPEVAGILQRVFLRNGVAGCDVQPLGDGGEGTRDIWAGVVGAVVDSGVAYTTDGRTAWVEFAHRAGFVPEDPRDIMDRSSFGVGEDIRRAWERGCREIYVGLGGSSTCDGGAGMLQALGARLRAGTEPLGEPVTPRELERIQAVDLPGELPMLTAVVDVDAPLLGPDGAARRFAPQKGATPAQVDELERGLGHWSRVLGVAPSVPGVGAAGGAAAGLLALGAQLRMGAQFLVELVELPGRCSQVDWVITGEGQLDVQTLQGKVCGAVCRTAAEAGVPVAAVVGRVGEGGEQAAKRLGLKHWVALGDVHSAPLEEPRRALEMAAERLLPMLTGERGDVGNGSSA